MSTYQVQETTVIDAPADHIFGIISDYHEGHPAILPPRYFTEMQVIQGGQGNGTVALIKMNVLGTKMLYQLKITEPEPGRVLREEDSTAGVVTTFTVDPINGGDQSKVTIKTTAQTSAGLRGWLERVMTPAITRRIYREELALLADLATHSGKKIN